LKTPAGFDCQYFYGDYYRGRDHEECRLIGSIPPPKNWTPDLCNTCPVPGIQRANACENLILQAKVKRGLLGFGRRVEVKAYCKKAQKTVDKPEIGCGLCHPLPPVFSEDEP
jgi:hypothetical protein